MIGFLTTLLLTYYQSRVPENMRHETIEETVSRITLISYALGKVCEEHPIPGWPYEACVALGATAVKWESGLLEKVHSGEKRGPSGELCLFQLHPGAVASDPAYRIENWSTLGGTDQAATERCVDAGMKTIAYHIHRCHIGFEAGGWFSGASVFAEFHVPSSTCTASISRMSVIRGRDYQKLYRKLKSEN